ncbi:MAG: hypothetical protein IPI79_10110 [Moraxellaceae bacterium]|nr:hypothetical protein [Moraxellaceae bacterium]
MGNIDPIDTNDAKIYLKRIVEQMTHEQIKDCLERDRAYAKEIKKKITALEDIYAYKTFEQWLDIEKITVKPMFEFPSCITLKTKAL